jgi:defect in organelle trafficking protein DotD
MNNRFLLVLMAALACTACTTSPARMNKPQLVAAPDRVSALLADAADRASNALQNLASVEQYKSPPANLARIDNAPVELRRAVTVAWVGPVDQIAKTLADRASYRFEILGDTPPVPVVVNLDVENKPVIDVLRDVGLQLGGRANVRVDSNRRVIELHYAPVTAS